MKSLKSLFGYEGKTVVVTGAASGMGKAAVELLVELGATVYALDISDFNLSGTTSIGKADLGDKEPIDRMVTQLPEKIDTVFICHGMAASQGVPLKVVKVNLLGPCYLAEKLLPRISDNGSIAFISSVAGFGWQAGVKDTSQLLECKDYDAMLDWCNAHPGTYESDPYAFSKGGINAYVRSRALTESYTKRRIRLNSICPGYTITGLTEAFNKVGSPTGDAEEGRRNLESAILAPWNGRAATAEEMGYPMVAFGSAIFSYMSGQTVFFDYGLTAQWEYTSLMQA